MKNDFTSIFKAIEPTEQESFRQYIRHFYGQQKAVLLVFEQTVVFMAASHENNFIASHRNHKNTLNALSDLKKWLLEFLAVQELKNNNYEAKFLMLEALHKRKLSGAFDDKAHELHREFEKHKSPDMWHLLWQLRLNHIRYFDIENDLLEERQDQMHQLLSSLDYFYIGTKLKYASELASRTYIVRENYETILLNEILLHVDTAPDTHPIITSLYLPLYKLTKEKSESAFELLKHFLENNTHHNRSEKTAILFYLLNFAIYRIRHGDKSYTHAYFEIVEIGLSQKLFTTTGFFPEAAFSNIINVCVPLKKYGWAKKFTADWSDYLEPADKNNTVNFALARICFEEKNFDETHILLQKIGPYKNFLFNIHVRLLLVRTFYEQKQDKAFINSHSNTFYQYIHRHKNIGQDMKTSVINFLKIFNLLANKKSKADIQSVLSSIHTPIICVDWLKEKIEVLKN